MIIITNDVEVKLLEKVKSIRGEMGGNYALHFHLSILQEHYRSEFQLKIAVNILNDIFRSHTGTIFMCKDGDLFIIYHGENKKLLEKAIFQLRYLFVDDPLANKSDGSENENFCTMYDITFQWRPFYRLCRDRLSFATQEDVTTRYAAPKKRSTIFTPSRLMEIESELDDIDIEFAIRKQSICAIHLKDNKNYKSNEKRVKSVFNEVYINMNHLRRLLSSDCNITGNKWLFRYLTESLDRLIFDLLLNKPKLYLARPVSINLNVNTILSDDFTDFCERMEESSRTSVVVEIDVSDVFSNMPAFLKAKDIVQERGYKICVDGLINESFVQVSRQSLGFDLAKLRWNADMEGDLGSRENKRLMNVVQKCGSNRIILCRCDDKRAIDYGHALGISLFQGRYPDRLLDPDAMIIN